MTESAKQTTQELNDQRLLAAQLHIQNNLDKDLSLASVARAAGTSASYFHRLFKAHLGGTLKTYTDRLRVENSLYDLIISDLKAANGRRSLPANLSWCFGSFMSLSIFPLFSAPE